MGSTFRRRNQQYAIAVETTNGTDAEPAADTDAIQISATDITPNFQTIDTSREVTGGLDSANPIPAGGYAQAAITSYLRGNATPGAAAPKIGRLLRAGACQETLLGTAHAGTAQAGASGSITLATGASSAHDAYKGMVIHTTGGAGGGQIRVVSAYNGTTKVATVRPSWSITPDITTTYSIDKCALYAPRSTGQECVSFYQWEHNNDPDEDSVLSKLIGAMGSPTLSVPVGKPAELTATLRGLFPDAPTDVTKPAAPEADTLAPPLFMNADVYLGGVAVKFNQLTLNFGVTVDQFDNPAQTFGVDEAEATARTITGEIAPQRLNIATRDAIGDFLNATTNDIWLRWGSVAGSRVSLYIPAAQANRAPDRQDLRGFTTERIPFQATGVDSGFYLSIY